MEDTNITAFNVSINDKATLNKSIAEGGKLTLDADFTLPCDLTVSGNNTLKIVFNNYSLNSGIYAIIVEDGGKLIVDGQTAKGTGSFTVEPGGTIETSNNSTINKAITVNDGTLTVSDSTVTGSITAKESKVNFTNVDVKMSQENFYAFLEDVMASNDSTMTNVDFYENSNFYFTVTKDVGKATTIAINYDTSLSGFTLSSTLTIPKDCDVTLDMNGEDGDGREIQIGTIEVNGTLTINGGNIRAGTTAEVTVKGKLFLNANNYFHNGANTLQSFIAGYVTKSGGTIYAGETEYTGATKTT